MFKSERVAVQLKGVSLNVVEMKEESKYLATCSFEINPLSFDLASELSDEIASHLFVVHGKGSNRTYEADPTFTEIAFFVDTSRYFSMTLSAADDADLPATVLVPLCICDKLRAKRVEAGILRATFTVTFEVQDPHTLWRVCSQWHKKDKTFLTFAETNPPLDFDDDQPSTAVSDGVH